MGESTCLMHSLSYVSGMPDVPSNQVNHVHTLGESVSFGRFTSESLAWEKWSAFPHKRYVEEAKSYAQPGSVAQKKAFFEAHYKKIAAQKAAAAALLEQEKAAAASHKSQVEESVCGINHNTHDLDTTVLLNSLDSPKRVSNSHESKTTELDVFKPHIPDASIATSSSGTNKVLVAANQKNKESLNNNENHEDHVSVSEDSRTSQMERPLLKSKLNTDQEVTQPMMRRKPSLPSFKSSSLGRKQSRMPPSPAKYAASMHPKKENVLTPRTKNPTTIESTDKKRAAPRSLYTLMNSGSARESCKLTSLSVRKTENAKPAPCAHTTPKRCATPMLTPSKVTNGVNKQSLATPSVKRRMETPVHPSAAGSKTPAPKWPILSAVSKSLSAYRNKLQSPTISTPFTLRTEERAARRKQKLEQKFNEKEPQKTQVQTTFKEKAETEFRRLRQTLCFKARPLPSFYNVRETPKTPIKKTPQANPKSLTPAKTTTFSTKKSSRRLWKSNDPNPAHHPLALLARKINHENISPNIQH